MARKTKALTPSERKLYDLLTLALHQLQDDEAHLSELVRQEESVTSRRTQLHLGNIGRTSAHLHEELRGLGLILRKREPYEDDAPIWSSLQSIHGHE